MKNVNVMIVEDERIVAMELRDRLETMGYSVPAVVSSGEEAMQKALETSPDLILMDIHLNGEVDGIRAAERIRAQQDIPVVYLTAYVDKETLDRAKTTNPFGYIVKPIDERKLRTTIEIALYKHRAEMQARKREQLLASALAGMGIGVLTLDTTGCVTHISPVAEKLTGLDRSEVLGKTYDEVLAISRKAS